MPTTTFPRFLRTLAFPMAAALTSAIVPIAAQATGASIAGPSVVRPAEVAVFSGRGFAANAAVSISITTAAGAESVFSAVAGADGTLSYQLSPRAHGLHVLRVLDSSGQELAKVNFIAME